MVQQSEYYPGPRAVESFGGMKQSGQWPLPTRAKHTLSNHSDDGSLLRCVVLGEEKEEAKRGSKMLRHSGLAMVESMEELTLWIASNGRSNSGCWLTRVERNCL